MFKPGDTVVCIDPGKWKDLTIGKCYVVSGCDQQFVRIDHYNPGGWELRRFKLVPGQPTLAPSREPQPGGPNQPPTTPYPEPVQSCPKTYKHAALPARATHSFPTHPSDILKLLSDI